MRTTPTGQRPGTADGDAPSTARKELDPLENHPHRPQSASSKKPREPSPAATTAARAPSRDRSAKPPSGRARSRGRHRNPLESVSDAAPPPPPAVDTPTQTVAEAESMMVQGLRPPPLRAEESDSIIASPSAPKDLADEDAGTVPKPTDAAVSNNNSGAPSSALIRRMVHFSCALFTLLLLTLTSLIVLAALQGPLLAQQTAALDGGVVERLCLDAVPPITAALLEEARCSHVLTNVAQNATSAADQLTSARTAYEASIQATDAQLAKLWPFSARDRAKFLSQVLAADVAAFREASPLSGGGPPPWVPLGDAPLSIYRRYAAGSVPSIDAMRVIDPLALHYLRQEAYAATSVFRTMPSYTAVVRQLPALCVAASSLTYTPRIGDAVSLGVIGELVIELATEAWGITLGITTASSTSTSGVSAQQSSGQITGSWEAVGLLAAARTFPVPIPAAAPVLSVYQQPLFPLAVINVSAPNLTAQLAILGQSSTVSSIRTQQQQLLGSLSTLMGSYANGIQHVSTTTTTTTRIIVATTAWIALGAVAAGSILFALYCLTQLSRLDYYTRIERELRSTTEAIARMRSMVASLRGLKTERSALSSASAASHRRPKVTRPEELALHAALTNLRDVEAYLSWTLSHPPKGTPPEAFNEDGGLNVRPYLQLSQGITALRVDLSTLHRHPHEHSTSKKQIIHHNMVRFLTAVEDALHAVVPSGFVTFHGFYAMAWIDLTCNVAYPCSSAIHLALVIAKQALETSGFTPHIAVVHGDVLAGNVGSLAAAPESTAWTELQHTLRPVRPSTKTPSSFVPMGDAAPPSTEEGPGRVGPQHRAFKSFTTFGPLNEEADMLAAVSRLHDAPITCNQAVTRKVYAELADAASHRGSTDASAAAAGFSPRDLASRVQFRGLELVVSTAGDGTTAAHDAMMDGASNGPSQAGTSLVHSDMGRLDHRVRNAQLVLEVCVCDNSTAGGGRSRANEWNNMMRLYGKGHLQQASVVLRRWCDVFGDVATSQRMQRLLAIAFKLHTSGDKPFVATRAEVLRDALVDVA